ncbi:MAG: hypothetical protein HYU75_20500 [Betaproteobacteria bacterium]|nr:hypothetical protein [Betaproteobacteria bacterium]
MRAALALAVALLTPAVAASPGAPGRTGAPPGALEPGVSRELARWR